MNRQLRNSQVAQDLRRLRFLKTALQKAQVKERRIRIINLLTRIIKSLAGSVRILNIKRALGSSVAALFFLSSAQLSGQSFGAPIPIDNPNLPSSIAPDLADIDGDGDLDLVQSSYAYYTVLLGYFENVGDSTKLELKDNFKPILVDLSSQETGFFVDMVDMDDDGDVDFNSLNLGNYDVLELNYSENLGNNDWSDVKSTIIDSSENFSLSYFDCNLVDMDMDGDKDLISIGYDNSDNKLGLVFVENIGTSETALWAAAELVEEFPDIDILSVGPTLVEVADYDSDGDMDMVISTYFDYDNYMYKVLYVENEGTTYAGAEEILLFDDQTGLPLMTTGDLDGDGDLDLLFNNFDAVAIGDIDLYWLENQGSVSTAELALGSAKFSLLSQLISNNLQIQYQLEEMQDFQLSIVNDQGVVLHQEELQPSSLQSTMSVELGGLSAGNYYLVINDGKTNQALKFFKF